MPHFIVEYAKPVEHTVQVEELMRTVYLGALKSELFEPTDIKVRAILFEHFSSGQTQQNFVHVCVKILSGRTKEQKSALSAGVLEVLGGLFKSSILLTVEIVDIDRATYSKLVLQ